MARIWAVALLALLPATALAAQAGDKDKGTDKGKEDAKEFKVSGKLTETDPKDKESGTPFNAHPYKMKKGTAYAIDMVSTDVDSYLRLMDPSGKQVAFDDDGGGYPNARIVYKAPNDGDYKIICTCFGQPMDGFKLYGNYTLTVREATKADLDKAAPKAPPPDPKHLAMLNKAAPDFTGEFALNGKAKQLSDLKGKVVLLDFWAVWCGPCIATFPHLREWNKEYSKDGLVILGATTYYDFTWDSDNNKLVSSKTKVPAADEQAMLKSFAAEHKLQHELLVLSKDAWSKASKDYSVSGIPTVVLIDRRGDVRMIRVGSGEGNAEALEGEIKKLLAEK
jgi:thiol-disulfide isomerase/thioredoxin